MAHGPAVSPGAAVARAPSGRDAAAARNDLRWVAVATLLAYWLGSVLELQELLAQLTAPLERWQLDELPLAVAVLCLGLAWTSWRRGSEAARLLAHNHELAQQLIGVQERERVALARELHDELAPHCTAIRVEVAYLRRAKDAGQVRAAAERAADSATHLMDGLRGILRRLRPAELDELGLVEALRALLACQAQRGGAQARLAAEPGLATLGPAADMAVYRIVQEGLANAVRHAGAQRITVTLARAGAGVAVRIADDGCGFDASRRTRGLGLLGAAERAAALGGRLAVHSAPGLGTVLHLELPGTPADGERAP